MTIIHRGINYWVPGNCSSLSVHQNYQHISNVYSHFQKAILNYQYFVQRNRRNHLLEAECGHYSLWNLHYALF